MKSEIEILSVEEAELGRLLDFQKRCYTSEALLLNDFSIQPMVQSREELYEEYRRGTILKAVYIGEPERTIGSVRGFAEGGTLHIGKLMVDPDCRKQGIGSRLLHAIEERFPARRYELFTSDKSESNLRLYTSHGYREFRRTVLSPGLVMVCLEKKKEGC